MLFPFNGRFKPIKMDEKLLEITDLGSLVTELKDELIESRFVRCYN